jgi:hypothetical protein
VPHIHLQLALVVTVEVVAVVRLVPLAQLVLLLWKSGDE